MQENIKELFTDLKDRITNPFTSSFIISWLITNYQIPIALIFYKQNELWRDRHHSFIDLIKDLASIERMIYIPLACSLAYTFIFPWIKFLIHAYRAWVEVIDDNNLKKIQANEIITKETYKKFQLESFSIIEKNANLIQENSELRQSLIGYKEENSGLQIRSKELDILKREKSKEAELSNARWLDGVWVVHNFENDTVIGLITFNGDNLNYERTNFKIRDLIFDKYNGKLTYHGPAFRDGDIQANLFPVYNVNPNLKYMTCEIRYDKLIFRKRQRDGDLSI